jgi:hypothetical protein
VPDSVVFTACTGHHVDDLYIRNDPGRGSLWEWAVEQAGGGQPRFDVITLTFSGNDLGFADILIDCYAPLGHDVERGAGSWIDRVRNGAERATGCDVTEDELRTRLEAFTADGDNGGDRKCAAAGTCATATDRFLIDDGGPGGAGSKVTGSLATLYSTIVERHLTRRGRLVVVGYPRLFAPSGEWKARYGRRCAGFSRGDANMLGRVAEYFDTIIHQQVNRANAAIGGDRIAFVSALDLFGGRESQRDPEAGHEVCGNGEDWLNAWWADGSGKRVDASFHPHELGHAAEAKEVAARLAAIDWPTPPPRPTLPNGWRWLEVPGAAIGVPNTMQDRDAAAASGRRPSGATARAVLPNAFHYAVSIQPLTMQDPRTGRTVSPADLDEYRGLIQALYDRNPELRAINGGPPRFETVRQAGGLDIVRSGFVSGTGDVSTTEWLVEVPNGGVIRFAVEIYIEDLSRYGRPPFGDYLATIWIDENAWAPPR